MNRKEYNAKREALLKRQAAIAADLAEAEKTNGVSLLTPDSLNQMRDAWDGLNDMEWQTNNAIQDLENQWARRNWTANDYNTAELYAANVD